MRQEDSSVSLVGYKFANIYSHIKEIKNLSNTLNIEQINLKL